MTVPGIDVPAVTAWLEEHTGARAPFAFAPITGGHSNLTYTVTSADGRRMVLRRPPLGHVLASAHDMAREHRIIAALDGTPVPVPTPLGLCEDADVNGAPFYVMDHVDGLVLKNAQDVEAAFPPEERGPLGDALVDVLADLHAVDPAAVGLGDLGRPDGYIERQLKRWNRQWREGSTRHDPLIAEAHERLSARVPAAARSGIVHGDFRLDNLLYRRDGSVAAVLDWELCTLGDPLADLGLLMVYWTEPDDAVTALPDMPTVAPGFRTRRELADRYAARSGADVAELGFYVAFGYWKLACILEGVYTRYRAGVMGDASLADEFEARPAGLARRALETLG